LRSHFLRIDGLRLAKTIVSTYGSAMRHVNIRAILLVTLAVFGIDFVSSAVLFGVFGGPPLSATPEQIRIALAELYGNSGYVVATLILGTASTVVGGYLTARLVRSVPYYNALAFGALGVLLGIAMSADVPAWLRIVGNAATVPAALLGAYLRARWTRTPLDLN
jgi:hypothetical protein